MRARLRTSIGTLVLSLLVLLPAPARAQALPPGCEVGLLPGGARSLICVPPAGWNGQLVVYAHGYVAPFLPLDFYQLTTADGTSLPLVVQSLGFAFATTTYRQNGLAILEGVGLLPFARVYQLVGKLQEQARRQLNGDAASPENPRPAHAPPTV